MIVSGLSLLANIVLLIFAAFYPVGIEEIENQKRIKPSIILTLIFSALSSLLGFIFSILVYIGEGRTAINISPLFILLEFLTILSIAFFLNRLLSNNLDIRTTLPLWSIPILIPVIEIILIYLFNIYVLQGMESSNEILETLIEMRPSIIGDIAMIIFGVVLLVILNSHSYDTAKSKFIPSNYKLGFVLVYIFSPICSFIWKISLGFSFQFIGSITRTLFIIIYNGFSFLTKLGFLAGFLLFLLGIPRLRAEKINLTEPY